MVNMSPKTLSMLKDVKENLVKGGKYEPTHNVLDGILKALFKEIKTDLKATIDTEKGLDEDYEDLMQTKYKEVNELQKSIAKKEKRKAEAEIELAAASQEYDDTDAQMNR